MHSIRTLLFKFCKIITCPNSQLKDSADVVGIVAFVFVPSTVVKTVVFSMVVASMAPVTYVIWACVKFVPSFVVKATFVASVVLMVVLVARVLVNSDVVILSVEILSVVALEQK